MNGNYAAGGYATYQLSGLTQNYYYGIRRYPYTTDMTKNPLTFKDIDPDAGQRARHGAAQPDLQRAQRELHPKSTTRARSGA